MQNERHYAFFQNRACEFFPCHETDDASNFNCLFCYCPLYALGPNCGGNYCYTQKGVKSCAGCTYPHVAEHYDAILDKLSAIVDIARNDRDI